MEEKRLEGRVIRLEEDLYFLEERFRQLDSQIASQQLALDSLEKSLRVLQGSLAEIRQMLSAHAKIPDARPPHYGPETW